MLHSESRVARIFEVNAVRRDPVNINVELNRFAYEPLDVGSLSQDRTSLSKIRVSLPWLTGSFFSDAGSS